MFLPDLAPADADGVAERIRCEVSTAAGTHRSGGHDQHRRGRGPSTAGVPVFVSVLAAADRALFDAKSAGRDRTSVVAVG